MQSIEHHGKDTDALQMDRHGLKGRIALYTHIYTHTEED